MQSSETRTILRSSIVFNPSNIKTHSADKVRQQKANLKRVGFLGGVVWNEASGNLIDGHRRVMALDEINHFDPSDPSTDYEIKVEAIRMDAKTEKEQMAFMAVANTKADYNLIADFIDEIDYTHIGIDESEYRDILSLRPAVEEEGFGTMEVFEDVFAPSRPAAEEAPAQEPQKPVLSEDNASGGTIPQEEGENPSDGEETAKGDVSETYFQAEEAKEEPQSPETAGSEPSAQPSAQPMTREEVLEQKDNGTKTNDKYMEDVDSYIVLNFNTQEEKQVFCDAFGLENKANMVVEGMRLLENEE